MKLFEVGDLVVYKSMSPDVIRNQIGIVIRVNITTEYQKSFLVDKAWYVVQFGSFILVVNEDMIDKIQPNYLTGST